MTSRNSISNSSLLLSIIPALIVGLFITILIVSGGPPEWTPAPCIPDWMGATASDTTPIPGQDEGIASVQVYCDFSGTMRGFLVMKDGDDAQDFVYRRMLKLLRHAGEYLRSNATFWKFGACVLRTDQDELNRAAVMLDSFGGDNYFVTDANAAPCPDDLGKFNSSSNISAAVAHALNNPSALSIVLTDMTMHIGRDSGGTRTLSEALAQAMSRGIYVGLIGVHSRFNGTHVDLEEADASVSLSGFRPCYLLLLGNLNAVRSAVDTIRSQVLEDIPEDKYFIDLFGDFSAHAIGRADIQISGNELADTSAVLTQPERPDIGQLAIAERLPEVKVSITLPENTDGMPELILESVEPSTYSFRPDSELDCAQNWTAHGTDSVECEQNTDAAGPLEFLCQFSTNSPDLAETQVHALALDVTLSTGPVEMYRPYDPGDWGYNGLNEQEILADMTAPGALFKTLNLLLLIDDLEEATAKLSSQHQTQREGILFVFK